MNDGTGNVESDDSNRRQFSRVNFRHELTMQSSSGTVYQGAFNDISLKGMLFWSEPMPKAGEQLKGEIQLGDDVLLLQGTVLHAYAGRGAAIRFSDLDVESFTHLRRLVGLNMGDPERIDEEFFSSL